MTDFRMPSLGADMDFGRVVNWRAAAGDRVTRGAVIVEVETDKGTFEVESPAGGVIGELIVAQGDRVPVGAVLATITPDGQPAATPSPGAPAPAPAAPAPVPVPAAPPVMAPADAMARAVPPSAAVRASPAARRAAAERGVDLTTVRGKGPDGVVTLADVEQAVAPGVPTTLERPAGAPRASPLARKMADTLGIDLATLTGTGAAGMITKSDVERAAAAPAAAAPQPSAPAATGAPTGDQAQAAMRRAIAAAVSRSKREIPHYYLSTDIDLGHAMAWLAAENLRRPVADRLLPSVLLLKSVATALRRFPALNGFWVDGAFRPGGGIHLGVAISLRSGGLIAPAILDADSKSLGDLMRAVRDLVQRARSGGLRGSEMTEPTITVTSLGDQGVTTVFGVIYPPQVAIVGFGKITERAWAENGMLAARPAVTVTLAADHRTTDGHYGGLFLAEVSGLLQTPEAL